MLTVADGARTFFAPCCPSSHLHPLLTHQAPPDGCRRVPSETPLRAILVALILKSAAVPPGRATPFGEGRYPVGRNGTDASRSPTPKARGRSRPTSPSSPERRRQPRTP